MDHDHLVGRIYELAEAEDGWSEVVANVSRAFGSDKLHALVIGPGGEVIEEHSLGADPAAFADYLHEHKEQDPRMEIAVRNPGRSFSDIEVIDPRAFERSPLYNELLAKVGIRYSLFVNQPLDDGYTLAQCLMRDKERGAFGPAERARFDSLLPHLRRARRLQNITSRTRAHLDDLRRALDLLPMALAVLDRGGKVVCLNEPAEGLLGHGLHLRDGGLVAGEPGDTSAMEAAFQAALEEAERRHVVPAKERPSVVHVREPRGSVRLAYLPLSPPSGIRERAESRARVLVAIDSSADALRLDPKVIAQLHGLTPTEAVLAAALAEGSIPAEIAAARGTSEHTVRTHLKRVLEKTGAGRQANLVRVLLGSSIAQLTRKA